MKTTTVARIHRALDAFERKASVSGHIVLKDGKHVATVRFSYPRDGAGKLQALIADWNAERPRKANGEADFENWTPWQYGCASGSNYDKHSAAVSGMTIAGYRLVDNGDRWNDQLRRAGFDVLCAI